MALKIVIAAMSPARGSIVECSHQLGRAFAQHGHEVLHLSTPVSPVHVARLGHVDVWRRLRASLAGTVHLEPGLLDRVPFSLLPSWVPGHIASVRNPMLVTVLPGLRRVLKGLGFQRVDALLIGQPLFAGFWDYLDCRRIVYHPTDVYPLLMENPSVARLERQILDVADAVISASQPVHDHVMALTRRRLPTAVIENGVDYEHFSRPAPDPVEYRVIPAPRAVFVGSIDRRFDWEAIEMAARALPHAQFVLIGPVTHPPSSRVTALRNIHVLGPRSYASVPGYLQHARVGLLPLSGHASNAGRSPMKLYEYLASGLEVVARHTPELERRREAALSLYHAAPELPSALGRVLAGSVDRARVSRGAEEHSWTRIGRRFLSFVETVPPVAERHPPLRRGRAPRSVRSSGAAP
ncbi:MAG TPA: glycosyltransferase [Methylomirabilota bacterium]|nr:glycosyltransferase [Methylomirabilota bacterium]